MPLPELLPCPPGQPNVVPPSLQDCRPSLQDALSTALGIPTRTRRPIHFPFSSALPQIDAPQRLAPALLRPFVEQHKPLLLHHPAFPSLPALLTAVDEHALQARVREPARLLAHAAQRLLVVFPVLPQESYVLPASIDALAAESVTLTYQDPRQEPRYRIPAAGPLTVHLAPSAVLTALDFHQLRLTRELSWRPGAGPTTLEGVLIDQVDLVADGAASPRPAVVAAASARPAWEASLHDISRGGAGLLLPPGLRGQVAVHHVVLLHLRLPAVRLVTTPAQVVLTLRVLGTVRAVRLRPLHVALHVRFLERLPAAFGELFAQLAREAALTPYSGIGEQANRHGLKPSAISG